MTGSVLKTSAIYHYCFLLSLLPTVIFLQQYWIIKTQGLTNPTILLTAILSVLEL